MDVHYSCRPILQVQVVNQASTFVQRAFNWRTDGVEDAAVDELQFHKAKCSIYLYYRCPHPNLHTRICQSHPVHGMVMKSYVKL